MIKKCLFTYFLFLALWCNVKAQTLAFPSAEGYGKYTTGGRGGKVYVVTNLNDSGAGSLREAIEAKGPRFVVFAVDGTIELKSTLKITNDNITIAGQSAPGDGICLKDYPLSISASNVIVRYIRIRVGDKYSHDSDAVSGGRYGQKNVILDHLSVSWSIDECLSIYKTENLTVQWCLIAHSLNQSKHTKGNHGFGGIWGGYKATFHHNMLANHASRNPRFSSVDGTKWVDFRNNVIYNWDYKTAYGGGHHAEINIVGNYYKPGPASKHTRFLDVAEDGTGRYYVSKNVMVGHKEITAQNAKGVNDKPGRKYISSQTNEQRIRGIAPEARPTPGEETASCLVETTFPYEPIYEDSPKKAYKRILKDVGCSFSRDKYDSAILHHVQKGKALGSPTGIINTPEEVGGWPLLQKGKPLTDSDMDGIPDTWEKKHKLNPNDASDASLFTLDNDYTNIETYLNSLSF